MLTKQDYLDYLSQIEEVEKKMADIYLKCCERVEDQAFRAIFEMLYKDEMRHDGMVKALIELVEK